MNIYSYPSLIASIVNLILGVAVYLRNRKRPLYIFFGLMSLSLAFWNILVFGFYCLPSKELAIFWYRLFGIGIWSVCPIALHFFILFAQAWSKPNRVILTFSYLLGIASFVASWLDRIDFTYGKPYCKYVPMDNTAFFLMNINMLSIVYGFYCLVKRYKQTDSPLVRVQIKYFFWGGIITLLLALTNVLTGFGIKIYPCGNLGNAVYTICIAYAIAKHRLMDIDVFINKTIVFVSLLVFIVIFHTIFVQLAQLVIAYDTATIISGLMIIFILLATPIRPKLQNLVDSVVYRGRYDYQRVIQKSTKAMVTILDWRELLNYLINIIAKNIGARRISLLLEEEETGLYRIKASYGLNKELVSNYVLKEKEGIISYLRETKEIFVKEDVERFLQEDKFKEVYQDLDRIGGQVCLPLFYKKRLLGVLNLDHKNSGRIYNQIDLDILDALSSEAAVAIENARLYDEAITDGLTRLYNHKYFQLRIKEEMRRAIRYQLPLSLLMMDIDHFKQINDRYGHQVGDMVLREISKIIKSNIRSTDIPSRYGGEEIAIILTHTSKQGAAVAADRIQKIIETTIGEAERLRHLIEEHKFSQELPELRVTVSIGVAGLSILVDWQRQNPNELATKLIYMADSALYKAKELGRNRVEIYESEQS